MKKRHACWIAAALLAVLALAYIGYGLTHPPRMRAQRHQSRNSIRGIALSISNTAEPAARSHGSESEDVAASVGNSAKALLSADQASHLARSLANQKARTLFRCEPFRDAVAAVLQQGRWRWRLRQGFGTGDFEATVDLAPDGSGPQVEVLLLQGGLEGNGR